MKKVLVSLLVLALAMTSVFAAVNFSGEFVAGYTFANYEDEWTTTNFGQDNVATDVLKLDASVADEDGIWSITMKGALQADGRLAGSATVDLGKAILGSDSDFSLALGLVANNRVAGLNAYNNASGFNRTRIRTLDKGLWTTLTVGYTDLVQVQVAGGPDTADMFWYNGLSEADKLTTKAGSDFLVSALVKPINGLAVSAGYVMAGENKNHGSGDGMFNAAVDVNIAELAGLDFDLGVSVGDRYELEGEANLIAATVYGGIDLVDVSVEYALETANDEAYHYFNVAANLNVIEGLALNVYTGAIGLCETVEFGDAFYVGGNVGYTLANVGLNLNVQYAEAMVSGAMGDVSVGAVKAPGFSITPSVTIAF